MEKDTEKRYPKLLKELAFDILLLDFIDERFNLLENEHGAICTMSAEFQKAKFERDARRTRIIESGSDEHLSLWRKGWEKFCGILQHQGRFDRLYVIKAYWSEFDDTANTVVKHDTVMKQNAKLDKFYECVGESMCEKHFLSCDPKFFVSKSNHVWGPAVFHYIDDYYNAMLEKIHEISHIK